MEDLYFEEIAYRDKEIVIDYINENVEYGSNINGLSRISNITFEEMFDLLQIDKFMPFTSWEQPRPASVVYLLMRKSDNKLLGTFTLRFYLTKEIDEKFIGNISYGIRPTERRKGYATKGLKLMLDKCRKRKMKTVRIGCKSMNVGSKKTILKNGGVLIKTKSGLLAEEYYEIAL